MGSDGRTDLEFTNRENIAITERNSECNGRTRNCRNVHFSRVSACNNMEIEKVLGKRRAREYLIKRADYHRYR